MEDTEIEQKSKVSTKNYYYLKWFGMITMLISNGAFFFHEQQHWNSLLYFCIRSIGQFCIPIFCYLLVQCFHYTEHKLKHCLKILLIAIVSEIPYDFFTVIKFVSVKHQNICFSLFISFFALYAMNVLVNEKFADYVYKNAPYMWLAKTSIFLLNVNVVVFSLVLAVLTRAEYSINVLLLVFMLELSEKCSHKKLGQLLAFVLYALSTLSIVAIISLVSLALIWIAQRNSEKEMQSSENEEDKSIGNGKEYKVSKFMKRISTIFYPLHFILLIGLRMFITIKF